MLFAVLFDATCYHRSKDLVAVGNIFNWEWSSIELDRCILVVLMIERLMPNVRVGTIKRSVDALRDRGLVFAGSNMMVTKSGDAVMMRMRTFIGRDGCFINRVEDKTNCVGLLAKLQMTNKLICAFGSDGLNIIDGNHVMVLRVLGRNVRMQGRERMNSHEDWRPAQQTEIEFKTVICSFWRKNNVETLAF